MSLSREIFETEMRIRQTERILSQVEHHHLYSVVISGEDYITDLGLLTSLGLDRDGLSREVVSAVRERLERSLESARGRLSHLEGKRRQYEREGRYV